VRKLLRHYRDLIQGRRSPGSGIGHLFSSRADKKKKKKYTHVENEYGTDLMDARKWRSIPCQAGDAIKMMMTTTFLTVIESACRYVSNAKPCRQGRAI
jgi:hypothetical protein